MHKPVVELPEVAYRHIGIEVRRASRQFHLNEDETEELQAHITHAVIVACAEKFNPAKGRIYTFVMAVVRNQLLKWKDAEAKRRNLICSATEAKAKRDARRQSVAPTGYNDCVDDQSYIPEEQRDYGEQKPESVFNGEKEWDREGLIRLLAMADVRDVIGKLDGDSKRLCKWFLKSESLRQTCSRLHRRSADFYGVIWPQCKADFIAKWRELGKQLPWEK